MASIFDTLWGPVRDAAYGGNGIDAGTFDQYGGDFASAVNRGNYHPALMPNANMANATLPPMLPGDPDAPITPRSVRTQSYTQPQGTVDDVVLNSVINGGYPQRGAPPAQGPINLNPPPMGGAGPDPNAGWGAIGDMLTGAGASLMSIYNPKGGSVLADLQKQRMGDARIAEKLAQDALLKQQLMNLRAGEMAQANQPDPPKFTATALKHVNDKMETYSTIDAVSKAAAEVMQDLKDKRLDLGVVKNIMSGVQNIAGLPTEQSAAYSRFQRFQQMLANDQLLLAKGVQTEGDAYRAMKQFAGGWANYSNELARDAIHDLLTKNAAAAQRGRGLLDSYVGMFGANPALSPFVSQRSEADTFYNDILTRYPRREENSGLSTGTSIKRPPLKSFGR
jgi:hypothetical protein